ncbi:hypothetical protein CFE70_007746 [Pyrenophora teres f. teres 0-1]
MWNPGIPPTPKPKSRRAAGYVGGVEQGQAPSRPQTWEYFASVSEAYLSFNSLRHPHPSAARLERFENEDGTTRTSEGLEAGRDCRSISRSDSCWTADGRLRYQYDKATFGGDDVPVPVRSHEAQAAQRRSFWWPFEIVGTCISSGQQKSPEESVVVGGPAEPSVLMAVPPPPRRSAVKGTADKPSSSSSSCLAVPGAQHAIVVQSHNIAGQQLHYGAIVAPDSRRRKRECKV